MRMARGGYFAFYVKYSGIKYMNVYIIYQGPTRFASDLLPQIDSIRNNIKVMWSTWEDEPKETLSIIRNNKNIDLILSQYPAERGTGNCNLQCTSTFAGINKIEFADTNDLAIKIRSDFYVDDINDLVDRIIVLFNNDPHKLIYLGYASTKENGEYLLDYIVAGSVDNMKVFWHPKDDKTCGMPFSEKFLTNRFYGDNLDFKSLLSKVSIVDISFVYVKWLKTDLNIKLWGSFLVLNYRGSNLVRLYFKLHETVGRCIKHKLLPLFWSSKSGPLL